MWAYVNQLSMTAYFMICIVSHETIIYIAKIMRNNIVDIKIMLNNYIM